MSDFDNDFPVEESVVESEATSFTMPRFKNWDSSRFYDHENTIVDYETIDDLNSAIKSARIALFELTNKINMYERAGKEAETAYKREWRRAYLKSSEKTESAKKIRADLLCEESENKMIAYNQVCGELTRMSNAMRLELQSLQGLGNNLRQQMKME